MTLPTYIVQSNKESPMAKSAAAKIRQTKLGRLPNWDLNDLYAAPNSKKLKSDLNKSEKSAKAFKKKYYGKISKLGGAALAAAVAAFLKSKPQLPQAPS